MLMSVVGDKLTLAFAELSYLFCSITGCYHRSTDAFQDSWSLDKGYKKADGYLIAP